MKYIIKDLSLLIKQFLFQNQNQSNRYYKIINYFIRKAYGIIIIYV